MFKRITLLFFVLIIIFSVKSAYSEPLPMDKSMFDPNIGYKIFFNGYDGQVNLIENVEIVGFTQIGGKDFLMIKSAGFSLSNEKGYILFDAITAIIPDRNIKVNRIKASGQKY